MYQRDNNDPPPLIDAVVAVEGHFRFHPGIDHAPNLEVTMMFVNGETKESHGTCVLKSHIFSPETHEALKKFLESAEADYGKIIFQGGRPTMYGMAPPNPGMVETLDGLPKTLGGK